jgi:phage tail-like protein
VTDSNPNESPHQLDPYRNYKFRVIWQGRTVAGVSKVGGLGQTSQVVTRRMAGPANLPKPSGQTEYATVTLERGITFDAAFQTWSNRVWDYGNSNNGLLPEPDISLIDFRHDITIQMQNEAGEVVLSYLISRCWVSEYHALPELDGVANVVAIQRLTLQNEGWELVHPAADATPPNP